METIYLTVSEKGRVKGKISGTVLRVDEKGSKVIGLLEVSANSHRGLETETVKVLVDKKELPAEAIEESGYIDYGYKTDKYKLIIIEGTGLNYYSIK